MKQKIILFFLFLFSIPTFGQDKSVSKYVFSLGYGYYDIHREMEDNYLHNSESYKRKYIYNLQSSLIGPIYAKLEKNISKKIGLAICVGYDQFTFTSDVDSYFNTSGNVQQYSANYPIAFPHDGTNNGDSIKVVTEKYNYKSFSFNLRCNLYFINKEKYQLYAGIGLGYRMNTVSFESNAKQKFPELTRNVSYLPSGLQDIYKIPVGLEITLSFRAYFYKNLGFYTELGLAKSVIQVGLCLRVQ